MSVPAPAKAYLAVDKAPPEDHDVPSYFSVHDATGGILPPKASAAFCVPAPAGKYLAVDKAPPADQADGPIDKLTENPTLPVTPNEPVISADPVYGNAGVDGAKEALVAVEANDALVAVEANDALVAVVALLAVLAFVANDALPNKLPVIPLVTVSDPVMVLLF